MYADAQLSLAAGFVDGYQGVGDAVVTTLRETLRAPLGFVPHRGADGALLAPVGEIGRLVAQPGEPHLLRDQLALPEGMTLALVDGKLPDGARSELWAFAQRQLHRPPGDSYIFPELEIDVGGRPWSPNSPVSLTHIAGSEQRDVWLTQDDPINPTLTKSRIYSLWSSPNAPNEYGVNTQTRVFSSGTGLAPAGVGTAWLGNRLQRLAPTAAESGIVFHYPFADGVFGAWEWDNPDYWTMHRFMCAKLAIMQSEPPGETCGAAPTDLEGQPLALDDEACE